MDPGNPAVPEGMSIAREINYFLEYYDALYPAVFLSCEREAFACICEDHKYGQLFWLTYHVTLRDIEKGKRND